MRKWARLKHPLEYGDQHIYKVMVYETQANGTFVFLYNSIESQICVEDEWYETVTDAMDVWAELTAGESWTVVDDPLPGCQADCVLPIRIKGRNNGKPEWGKYEILVGETWSEYKE